MSPQSQVQVRFQIRNFPLLMAILRATHDLFEMEYFNITSLLNFRNYRYEKKLLHKLSKGNLP